MKYNIKKIRRAKGLTQSALVEAANISQPYLSQLENGVGGRAPSMETLQSIARVLNVKPSELIDDAEPITIVGKVGAGARVPLFDSSTNGEGLYKVASPPRLPHAEEIVGVEIEGDSMFPVYDDGDILFYKRESIGVPSEALNAKCICEDSNGDAWVKYLKAGAEPDKFNLISFNPSAVNMFDVELKWASPVRLHWPRDLVERM